MPATRAPRSVGTHTCRLPTTSGCTRGCRRGVAGAGLQTQGCRRGRRRGACRRGACRLPGVTPSMMSGLPALPGLGLGLGLELGLVTLALTQTLTRTLPTPTIMPPLMPMSALTTPSAASMISAFVMTWHARSQRGLAACGCSLGLQLGVAAWGCSVGLQRGAAACSARGRALFRAGVQPCGS